jgi:hypothetical protein
MCFPLGLNFYEFIQKWHIHFNVRIQEETHHYIVCEIRH